jgi:hypothetical protein
MKASQYCVSGSPIPSTTRVTSESRSGRSRTPSPSMTGLASQVERGSRGSSRSRVPTQASRSSPRCGCHCRTVPSSVKPSRQATRRDAQLPTCAHQMTVCSPCSSKPQSSSRRSARSTCPVPRTHGCEPYASSARPEPSGRSETVPAYRPETSTANAHSDPSAQPAGQISSTKVRASSIEYGTGTVVQRWDEGSWHCSNEPSASSGRWARSVTGPSVRVGITDAPSQPVTQTANWLPGCPKGHPHGSE